MHTRIVKPKRGPTLLVRPLRPGDTDTVNAMFERLGTRRAAPASTARSLASAPAISNSSQLPTRTITCSWPMCRATRGRPRSHASFATARAPRSRSRSPTSSSTAASDLPLPAELIADARAAGITEITALVASDNPAAVALLRRILSVLDIRYEGPELSIRAALP